VRILLLIVLVAVAIWAVRRAVRAGGREERAAPPAPGELVSCARCGLHLPRTEAREVAGRLFCSDEHARLGVAPKG
jgi:uncharacterized protein